MEIVIGGLALAYVALQNVRGLSAERLGMVLRLSLFGLGLLVLVAAIAFAQEWDPGAITDSIELGSAPAWDDVLFATVVAAVALTGVEAASGLAGEVRVGRHGLRRVVLVVSGVALLLFAGVSAAALMAVPVVGGETALGGRYLEAPVLGVVNTFEPAWLMDSSRYVVGATAGAILIVGMNGQMLGLARLSYSLATNRQIPSAAGRLSERRGTPYIAIALAAAIAFAAGDPARHRLPGGHLRLRRDDHVLDRARVGDRAALPRARPPQRLPGAFLDPRRGAAASRCRRCWAPSCRSSPG